MLEEGRKLRIASKVADAILAAAAAATMAQSPQHFVSFGAVQSSGVAKGQEEGRKRGEAERNLDSGRVVARNVKKKTFKEFVEESYLIERGQPTFSSREELEKHYGGVPAGMVANNAARSDNPKWRLVKSENRKEQAKRRAKIIKSLNTPEERAAADKKRNN